MTIKSTKLALALLGALSFAAPLALGATPAEAAPVHNGGGMMQIGVHNDMGHVDMFHDQRHRPPVRRRSTGCARPANPRHCRSVRSRPSAS